MTELVVLWLTLFFFWDSVLYIQDWLRTYDIAEDNFELIIFPHPPTPDCLWNECHIMSGLHCDENENRALWILDTHSSKLSYP